MFNKYFDLVKALFESVFKTGGERVHIVDYLYVLGFTFALIGAGVAILAILFGLWKIPAVVYKKFTGKVEESMEAAMNALTSAESENDEDKVAAFKAEYDLLEEKLTRKNIIFASGIVLIYLPFVIPTILFILSLIKSCF